MEKKVITLSDISEAYTIANESGISSKKTSDAFNPGSLPSEGTFDEVTIQVSESETGDNTSNIRINCGMESLSMGSVQISGFQKPQAEIKAEDAIKTDKHPGKLFLIGDPVNPTLRGDQIATAFALKGRKFTTEKVNVLCSTPKFTTGADRKLIPASTFAEAKNSLKARVAYKITVLPMAVAE